MFTCREITELMHWLIFLTGDVNPSGKLPITYPRYTNALVSYIHKPSEGDSNPQGGMFKPQWPFGLDYRIQVLLTATSPSIKTVLVLTKRRP